MAKLIIMQGLPGSGKSTAAKEIMKQGNTIRINKDLLRTMLHFDKWTGRNEGITCDVSFCITRNALKKGSNVIIDDTNLNENVINAWRSIAKEMNAKIEYRRIETPYDECIRRDMIREKCVGPIVIKNMALQYGLMPKPEKGYVLCDIDGTIADISHRLHFVQGVDKKDWKSFFAAIPGDVLRADTKKLLDDFAAEGYDIIFISARPQDYQGATLKWFADNGILNFVTLIMRPQNDKRPDTEFKKDMLNKYFKDKSVIHKVIDDRPSVIRMWREQGLEVMDVGKGVEF